MGNCKDCKFWGHHEDYYGKKWDSCGEVDSLYTISEKIPDDDFSIYANAEDDSGLFVELITGPMFGCTKFSPKPIPQS